MTPSKLTPPQQDGLTRLKKEKVVAWSSTTATEARALNDLVKQGVVQKKDATTYVLVE